MEMCQSNSGKKDFFCIWIWSHIVNIKMTEKWEQCFLGKNGVFGEKNFNFRPKMGARGYHLV